MFKVGNKVKLVKDFKKIGVELDAERIVRNELQVGISDAIERFGLFAVCPNSEFVITEIDSEGDIVLTIEDKNVEFNGHPFEFTMYTECIKLV